MSYTLELLEELGLVLGLDWDGELLVDCPERIASADLEEAIARFRGPLTRELAARGRRQLKQLVGGPFNGQRNDLFYCPGAHYGKRVGRAKWAVYQQRRDGRAFFRGYATSEAKARRCQLIKSQTGANQKVKGREPRDDAEH